MFPEERGINPISVNENEIKELFKNSDRDVVRTLAMNGLGSLYAEEIIQRAGKIIELDKNAPAVELNEEHFSTLQRT